MATVKTVNGLALASMKTKEGLAAASIKTIDGLDAVVAAALVVENAWQGKAIATSAAITVSPTAGNLLVVAVFAYGGVVSAHTVSDNIDSTTGWTLVAGQDAGLGNPVNCSLWYKKNCPAGITAITTSGGVSSVLNLGIAHEVSGASTSAPFTAGQFATVQDVAAATTHTSGNVSNATPASVIFAICTNSVFTNPATMTINTAPNTVGTYNLKNSAAQNLDTSIYMVASMPNQIVAATATQTHEWTTNNAAGVSVIAAFH